jgi:hypothetical protein
MIMSEALEGQTAISQDGQVEGQAVAEQEARSALVQVRAVWQANFWGAKHGHEEPMDLTELVARVAAGGKLLLFDLQTGERIHPTVEALAKTRRPLRPRVRPGQG